MKKTWGLVVDTTLQGAHVALVSIEENKGRLVHVSSCHDTYSSAAKLAVSVEKMLEVYDLKMNDICSVLLANGPGTFTGIKIGLSFVSALMLADKNLKVMTHSGIQAYSEALEVKNLCFIPATKTQGYACHYDGENAQLYTVEINGSELVLREENSDQCFGLDSFDPETVVTLKPWSGLEQIFTERFKSIDLVNSTYQSIVSLNEVADWSRAACDLDIAPRYLRRSAPEEKLIKEGKLN